MLSYTRCQTLFISLATVRITTVIVTGGRGKIHCFKSTISLCLTRNYKQRIRRRRMLSLVHRRVFRFSDLAVPNLLQSQSFDSRPL